jgi:hypothetical protein
VSGGLKQQNTTALFRRNCRRAARSAKPGCPNVKECDRADYTCFEMRINRESRLKKPGSVLADKTPWSGDRNDIDGCIGADPDDNVKITPDGDL